MISRSSYSDPIRAASHFKRGVTCSRVEIARRSDYPTRTTSPQPRASGNWWLRTKWLCLVTVLLLGQPAQAQYLGVTCGWSYGNDLTGPYSDTANHPLFNPVAGEPNGTWDNWAEELAASGVDFVCPNLRGSWPNTDQNPTNLAPLLVALSQRGLTNRIKLAIFDDNAASWTAQWNQANGRGFSYAQPFDISAPTNWVYLWDYNYKLFYETVPDANRFKINGRPVIIIWSGNTYFVSHMQGNASKALLYVRQQCQATFGFNPYIIVSGDFLPNDTTCNNPSVVDAVHNWFAQGSSGYTQTIFNGVKIGACCPQFQTPAFGSGWIDPQHGQTLAAGLANTRSNGALLTLVEGFTDWEESAALFRVNNLDSAGTALSYDQTYYDYPNQRLNLLRQAGNHATPCELRFEAEACDDFGNADGGNGRVNFYRNGTIAIEPTGDTGGGYNVGWIQPGEWLEWRQVPIQGSRVRLQVRVASPNNNGAIHFVIDGTNHPALTIPNTGDWQAYTNLESGTAYAFAKGSTHTVRLVCDTGGFNINAWQYHNDIPIGDTVTLRSAANQLLVSATNSTSPLQASRSTAGRSEEFQLLDQSSTFGYGCVALKALVNNLFVTADPTGTSALLANATNAGLRQTFAWSDNADGTVSLRALVNQMNVSAGNAGALPLLNNWINCGLPETFALTTVPPKLTASRDGANLTIAWPANYLGWILQTNRVGWETNGTWGDVPGSHTNAQLSFPIQSPDRLSGYFRLHRP